MIINIIRYFYEQYILKEYSTFSSDYFLRRKNITLIQIIACLENYNNAMLQVLIPLFYKF